MICAKIWCIARMTDAAAYAFLSVPVGVPGVLLKARFALTLSIVAFFRCYDVRLPIVSLSEHKPQVQEHIVKRKIQSAVKHSRM